MSLFPVKSCIEKGVRNMALTAIKYRAYPTLEQAEFFQRTFGCVRKIWNCLLADSIEYYKFNKKHVINQVSQYKAVYPYLKDIDSLALANARVQLQTAYKRFFKKTSGFPKFKSKHKSKRSYTTNNQGNTIALLNTGIKLPKVYKLFRAVKIKLHRKPADNWRIKSATVSMNRCNEYYISILFEYEDIPVRPVIKQSSLAIGLDYKSDGLYVDNNGKIGSNHRYFKESQKQLARAQRKLSRRQGSRKNECKSHNYMKQLQKVNKIHRHISNQRLDNLHKISTKLVNQYDIICVEDLNMRNLSNKGFGNGKSTMDNGYGMFLDMLAYKFKRKGGYLVKVSKWYPSSQLCSVCGKKHPEMKIVKHGRKQEYLICDCGNRMQRDLNAAKNILNEGLRILRS